MPKNERFDFDRPPVPTPKQLRNSIGALRSFNPYDERIKRYESMETNAQERFRVWQAKVKRAKAVYRRRAT